MKRAAVYIRVSTDHQDTANQRRELEAVAAHRGWKITQVYEDAGISGAKGRDKRPGLDAMMKNATRRKFDIVMAWSLDRIGRSLHNLLDIVGEMDAAGVDIFLHKQAIDTTTAGGKLMFHIFGALAEWERGVIRERVQSAMNRIKAEQDAGKERFGPDGRRKKPIGHPSLKPAKIARITQALDDGLSMRAAGKICGVSRTSVLNVKKTLAAVP